MLSISRQHELKSLVNVSIARPLWELFHFICWFRQSFRSWNNNLYFALKIMVELVTSNNLFHSDVEGLDGKDEPHDISTLIVWRRYFCVYAKINLCFSSPTDCGAEFFLNLVGGGKRSCTSAAGSRAAKWTACILNERPPKVHFKLKVPLYSSFQTRTSRLVSSC